MNDAYVAKVLADELKQLGDALPGVRNKTLFSVATRLYQFVAAGLLAEEATTAELVVRARNSGLAPAEVQATLRSAGRHAQRKPLSLPASNPLRRGYRPPTITLAPPEDACPPSLTWQAYAEGFCRFARRLLWQPESRAALDWLLRRGLRPEMILRAGLGFNRTGFFDERASWGLPLAEWIQQPMKLRLS